MWQRFRNLIRRLRLWLRTRVQQLGNVYYEGPDPPARHAQAVMAFAAANPKASQQDWIMFSAGHAHECYRSGYMRGVEWKARSEESRSPAVAAALLAQEGREDWSWVDLVPAEEQLAEMIQLNPEIIERMSPEERVMYTDRIGQQMGGFRVVLVPPEEE